MSCVSATIWRGPGATSSRARNSVSMRTMPQQPYRWRVAMARLRQAEGGAEEALVCWRRPSASTSATSSPTFARSRRCELACGSPWAVFGKLVGWAREAGCRRRTSSLPGRVRAHHPGQAAPCGRDGLTWHGGVPGAGRGAPRSSPGGRRSGSRTGSVIEILILEALAAADRGDSASALAALEQALTAAEPEGYVRVFVDEGPAMTALLREASRRGISTGYIEELLAGGERPSQGPGAKDRTRRPAQRAGTGRAPAPWVRTERPRHRSRAHGVPQHLADPHEEHLHEAWREQPSGCGQACPGAKSVGGQTLGTLTFGDEPRLHDFRGGPFTAKTQENKGPWASHGQRHDIGHPDGPPNGINRRFFGADDGIRTRDPHLGKVMGKVQVDRYKSLTCGSVRRVVHCIHPVRACRIALYHARSAFFRQGDAIAVIQPHPYRRHVDEVGCTHAARHDRRVPTATRSLPGTACA